MTPTIELDDGTHRALEFAARVANCTTGEVVARLVEQASMSQPVKAAGEAAVEVPDRENGLAVYADYDGHRTLGTYDQDTSRIDITSGPLKGSSYKTPTGAARAVISHYKPEISPHRNGWSFWLIDDGNGRFLQNIRHG